MRRKIIPSTVVVALFYFVSYCAFSADREVDFKDGDYRIVSMRNTRLSDDVLFSAYRPIIWLDEATMGSEELDLKPE